MCVYNTYTQILENTAYELLEYTTHVYTHTHTYDTYTQILENTAYELLEKTGSAARRGNDDSTADSEHGHIRPHSNGSGAAKPTWGGNQGVSEQERSVDEEDDFFD